MSADRAFDVVVFGATGFTGTLVLEYLAQHARGARWAIAGRSVPKLAALRERARALSGGSAPEILEADVGDPASLLRMASSTRVVLTTVGPYSSYGDPVVAACVEGGADYVDITGEPGFVADMIARHGASATARGVRLVPCCGFDSIPHDLGTQYTVEQLPTGEALTVRGYFAASGMFSGGTFHSAIQIVTDRRHAASLQAIVASADPGKRSVRSLPFSLHREALVDGWGLPAALIDPAIVLRSAALMPEYGPDFAYGHFAHAPNFPTAAAIAVGMGAFVVAARTPALRPRLERLRTPGEGPSEELRKRSWFRVDFIGESVSGKRVLTRVSGGDPGYSETAKMLAESALCLALERERLPARAGVLTPASAMGPTLRRRLVDAGIRFEVLR